MRKNSKNPKLEKKNPNAALRLNQTKFKKSSRRIYNTLSRRIHPLILAVRNDKLIRFKKKLAAITQRRRSDPTILKDNIQLILEKALCEVASNSLTQQNNTPLYITCLLENGANPNITTKSGQTLMHFLIQCIKKYGYAEEHEKCAEILCKEMQNVNQADAKGITPLQVILNDCIDHPQILECMPFLIKKGANPNITTQSGQTLMHLLIQCIKRYGYTKKHKKCAEILCNTMQNVNQGDEKGITPLHVILNQCINYPQISECIPFLIKKGANPNITTQSVTDVHSDATFMHIMIEMIIKHPDQAKKYTEYLKILGNNMKDVNQGDAKGYTPPHLILYECVCSPHVLELLGYFLKKGANPNAQTKLDGSTPLHLYFRAYQQAIEQNKFLVNPVEQLFPKLLALFLSYELDLNIYDNDGDSLLTLSLYFKNTWVLEFLVKNKHLKADLNQAHEKSGPPLHVAAYYNNIAGTNILLKHGATQRPNKAGKWPIHFAKTPEMLKILIDDKADINARDKNGRTLLHIAAINNQRELSKFALEHKADPNIPDRSGKTPLFYSRSVPIWYLLIKHKANIHARDNNGRTLLYKAAWDEQYGLLQYLLEHKVNPNIPDNLGHTPLLHAYSKNAEDLLKKYGADEDIAIFLLRMRNTNVQYPLTTSTPAIKDASQITKPLQHMLALYSGNTGLTGTERPSMVIGIDPNKLFFVFNNGTTSQPFFIHIPHQWRQIMNKIFGAPTRDKHQGMLMLEAADSAPRANPQQRGYLSHRNSKEVNIVQSIMPEDVMRFLARNPQMRQVASILNDLLSKLQTPDNAGAALSATNPIPHHTLEGEASQYNNGSCFGLGKHLPTPSGPSAQPTATDNPSQCNETKMSAPKETADKKTTFFDRPCSAQTSPTTPISTEEKMGVPASQHRIETTDNPHPLATHPSSPIRHEKTDSKNASISSITPIQKATSDTSTRAQGEMRSGGKEKSEQHHASSLSPFAFSQNFNTTEKISGDDRQAKAVSLKETTTARQTRSDLENAPIASKTSHQTDPSALLSGDPISVINSTSQKEKKQPSGVSSSAGLLPQPHTGGTTTTSRRPESLTALQQSYKKSVPQSPPSLHASSKSTPTSVQSVSHRRIIRENTTHRGVSHRNGAGQQIKRKSELQPQSRPTVSRAKQRQRLMVVALGATALGSAGWLMCSNCLDRFQWLNLWCHLHLQWFVWPMILGMVTGIVATLCYSLWSCQTAYRPTPSNRTASLSSRILKYGLGVSCLTGIAMWAIMTYAAPIAVLGHISMVMGVALMISGTFALTALLTCCWPQSVFVVHKTLKSVSGSQTLTMRGLTILEEKQSHDAPPVIVQQYDF